MDMYNAINPISRRRIANEKESILYVLDIPEVGVKFKVNIPQVLQSKS